MSKVITFSRKFPSGRPTYFIEKIWQSFDEKYPFEKLEDKYCFKDGEIEPFWDITNSYEPKYHTIRGGNRWKVGDFFSPRVWSDKPYRSPQLIFAPDIQVKKVWSIDIITTEISLNIYNNGRILNTYDVAKNDGLSVMDFENWFGIGKRKTFSGQIICWSDKIEY